MKLLRNDKSITSDDFSGEFARLGWLRGNASSARIRRFVAVDKDTKRSVEIINPRKILEPNVRSLKLINSATQSVHTRSIARRNHANIAARIGLFAGFLGVICGSVAYVTSDSANAHSASRAIAISASHHSR
jgi:hypothetical protein